jgi:alpha-galactosidase
MIPFGHIGIKCTIAGKDRQTRFTHDEQLTLMSLWSLASSPLILGNNLPDTDEWTLSLLTNDEVLAIDQDPLGIAAKRVSQKDGLEVWVKDLKDGSKAIGLFNRSPADASVTLDWTDAGLTGSQTLRDLWQHKDLGSFDQTYSCQVPSHGVVLLLAKH